MTSYNYRCLEAKSHRQCLSKPVVSEESFSKELLRSPILLEALKSSFDSKE